MHHLWKISLVTVALLLCGIDASAADPPVVIVVEATLPGANAKEVADKIGAPIEKEVDGVLNRDRLISKCTNEGKYILYVHFPPGSDARITQVLVQNRVSLALPNLPEAAQRNGVTIKKQAP